MFQALFGADAVGPAAADVHAKYAQSFGESDAVEPNLAEYQVRSEGAAGAAGVRPDEEPAAEVGGAGAVAEDAVAAGEGVPVWAAGGGDTPALNFEILSDASRRSQDGRLLGAPSAA